MTTSQPRMSALATVLPTRIVHKKFSGFSRYSCNNLADGSPALACCRIRKRLKAKSPASMPDKKNDKASNQRQPTK